MKKLLILLILVLSLSYSYAVLEVGHPSSEIMPGTFSSGNYTFPNNLVVTSKVGIGTTDTSLGKFYINADNRTNGFVMGNISDATRSVRSYYRTLGLAEFVTSAGGQIQFSTAGIGAAIPTGIRIKGDGNVGIGTTNPQTKLDVRGNLDIWNSGTHIRHFNSTGSQKIYESLVDSDKAYEYRNGSGSIILSLNYGGNVGIGTTSPNQKLEFLGTERLSYSGDNTYYLDIAPTWHSANNIRYDFKTQVANAMTIAQNGNVGIGTTNPVYKLQVTDANGHWYIGSPTGGYGDLFYAGGPGNVARIGASSYTSGSVAFMYTNSSGVQKEAFRINTLGNVGIGNTNPNYLLEVGTGAWSGLGAVATFAGNVEIAKSGTGNNPVLNIREGQGGSYMQLKQYYGYSSIQGSGNPGALALNPSGSNVGIGMTSPTAKLEIYRVGSSTSDHSPNLVITSNYTSATTGGFGSAISFRDKTPGTFLLETARIETQAITGYNSGNLLFYTLTSAGAGTQEKMRIDFNGNVGIGTTNPGAKLELLGNSSSQYLGVRMSDIAAGGRSYQILSEGGLLKFSDWTNFGVRMVLNGATGNVGIGTTSPGAKLDVAKANYNGGGTGAIRVIGTSDPTKILELGMNESDNYGVINYLWSSHNGYLLKINPNGGNVGFGGNVGIGSNSPDSKLLINGYAENQIAPRSIINILGPNGPMNENGGQDIRWTFSSAGTAIIRGYRDGSWGSYISVLTSNSAALPTNGVYIGNAATSWSSTSDIRLKENIQNITNALDKLESIRGVSFDWKNNHNHQLGLIAQEVNLSIPEIVDKSPNGYLSIRYTELIPVLVNGIKEQQQQIDKLQTDNDLLKQQNNKIISENQEFKKLICQDHKNSSICNGVFE